MSFLILHTKSIAKIRYSITFNACTTIIKSLVLSRFDYCNSLLAGSTKLQVIKKGFKLKMTCRIMYKLSKYDLVTKHVQKVCWMLYPERINYKIGHLTFKGKNNTAPAYLSELVQFNQNSDRQHRSCYNDTMVQNQQDTKCILQHNRTKLWNAISSDLCKNGDISIFKGKLKTYFFKKIA